MAVDRTDSFESRAERGVFGVHIEGCPFLFVSSVPVGPDGVAWSAPQDYRTVAYTVEDSLIARDGLASTDSTWKPKEGLSEGGAFSFRLSATANVKSWFSTEKTGRISQAITADTDYDAAGVANADKYAVYVDDETAYDATGYVYVGRETIYYDDVDAVLHTLGDGTSGNMDRGCWNWQSDSLLSRHHYSAEEVQRMTVFASSHPEVHRGRRVTVLYWQADEHGRCYDSAYKGDHEIEVRSGYIKDFGPSADNWAEFDISCDDLTSAIRNDIGAPIATCEVPSQPGTIQFTDAPYVTITTGVVAAGSAVALDAERVAVVNPDDSAVEAGTIALERYAVALAYTVQKTVNAVAGNANTLITGGRISQGVNERGGALYAPEMYTQNDTTGTGLSEYNYIEISANFGADEDLGFSRGADTASYAALDSAWSEFLSWRGGWNQAYPWAGGIGSGAQSIIVKIIREDAIADVFPSSGYAKLTAGDALEWVYYDSVTTGIANGVPEGYVRLNVTVRGLFNTTAQSFTPSEDGSWEFAVEVFTGWEDESLATIVSQIFLSTGTTGAYGTDDVLSRKYGLGLDPASVDIDAIKNSSVLGSERTWLFADETSFENVIKDEAILNGFVFTARTDRDGRYRLTAVPVQQPSLVSSSGSFSVADGTITSQHQKIRRTTGALINEVKVSVSNDPTGESKGPTYRVIDTGGRETYGESKTLEVKMRGLNEDARIEVLNASYRLFYLFGRPYWVLEFETDRSGLSIQAGDTIDITIPGIWTPYGSDGFASTPGSVLQIRKNWFANGSQSATRMSAVLFPAGRGFAPTFEVDSYASGTPSITISDNVFSDSTDPSPFGLSPCRDWHFGPPSGETWPVVVYQQGDFGNAETVLATSAGTATWTLNTTLTMTVGANDTFVEFAPYTHASIDAEMKLYAYIADTSKTLGAGGDTAHTWTS